MEHAATAYEKHVPPIYAVEAPTITIPIVVRVPFEVVQYKDIEGDVRAKEDEFISSQLISLKRAIKSFQVTRGGKSLDYEDRHIHTDIDMPVG